MMQVGHGTIERVKLDGLVCEAVLAFSEGVVGRKVQSWEVAESTHTDSRCGLVAFSKRFDRVSEVDITYIEIEHQERGCNRDKGSGSIRRNAVGDASHGVLTDTVSNVSAGVVFG